MKSKLLMSLLLLSGLFISGCASIVTGSSQNINIATSTGDSVKAEIVSSSGIHKVELPTVLAVKRSSKDIVIMVKEADNKNYKQSTYMAASRINMWTLGNLINFTGLCGFTTDGISGAAWTYDDNIFVPVTTKTNN